MEDQHKGFWTQFYNRTTRLILTLISKQWLGFFIATALLVYKCITPEVWVVAFGAVVISNVAQKKMGVINGKPTE